MAASANEGGVMGELIEVATFIFLFLGIACEIKYLLR
jgi:hypothetical protein